MEITEMTPELWREYVGDHIKARRLSLAGSPSIREMARRSGLSEATWRQVENGKRQVSPGVYQAPAPNEATSAAMGRALDWPPDIIVKLLMGDPSRIVDVKAPSARVPSFRERALEAMRAEVHDLADQMEWSPLFDTVIAMLWAAERSVYGPTIEELEMTDVPMSWLEIAPSLDELLWDQPTLDEVHDIVQSRWAAARARWDAAVQERGQAWADSMPDPEDHAMAAGGGQRLDEDPAEGASDVRPKGYSPIERDPT